jgi:dihydrofolate synthase/folylpolyglutamate synthase
MELIVPSDISGAPGRPVMQTESAFDDAVRYLDSLQGSGIRPGLTRMRKILAALAAPQHAVPSVLVAGTNGKGSTCATLESILRACGYAVGFYSSPHLIDLRERWRIGGQPIDPALFVDAVDHLRRGASRAGVVPTYFEALTLVAFLAFRDAGCDIAVLEVGMGGRLDATNVVRPMVSLITAVDFDHMEYLGRTIRAIAREKAGIIHRHTVAVTSNVDPQILEVLGRRAARFDVPLHLAAQETKGETVGESDTSQTIRLVTPTHSYELQTPLRGPHQIENIALAVRAAEELSVRFEAIHPTAIVTGVARTEWGGRLERVVLGQKTFWIDGGHNPGAAAAIAAFIDSSIAAPRLLVFGIMADKDVEAVTKILMPRFTRVITTEPYPPRSASAAALAELAHSYGIEAESAPLVNDALEAALAAPEPTVVVCGSLYLAGAALDFLNRHDAAPTAARTVDRNHAAATR